MGGLGIAVAMALAAVERKRAAPPETGEGKSATEPTTAPPDETWSRQRRRAWERKHGRTAR